MDADGDGLGDRQSPQCGTGVFNGYDADDTLAARPLVPDCPAASGIRGVGTTWHYGFFLPPDFLDSEASATVTAVDVGPDGWPEIKLTYAGTFSWDVSCSARFVATLRCRAGDLELMEVAWVTSEREFDDVDNVSHTVTREVDVRLDTPVRLLPAPGGTSTGIRTDTYDESWFYYDAFDCPTPDDCAQGGASPPVTTNAVFAVDTFTAEWPSSAWDRPVEVTIATSPLGDLAWLEGVGLVGTRFDYDITGSWGQAGHTLIAYEP